MERDAAIFDVVLHALASEFRRGGQSGLIEKAGAVVKALGLDGDAPVSSLLAALSDATAPTERWGTGEQVAAVLREVARPDRGRGVMVDDDERVTLRNEPTSEAVEAVLVNPDAGGGYFTVTEVTEWLRLPYSKRATVANRLDRLASEGRAVCEQRPVGRGGQWLLTYRAPGEPLGDEAVPATKGGGGK